MSVGLLAVVDDILSAALKASAKTAGVVIDDAAVTPQYVQGLTPARELPVVGRIALGSLGNKAIIIVAALILTQFAPWVLPYLLILGGTYLCYEGAVKVLEWFGVILHATHETEARDEKKLVFGAVRTDLILSTEILLIALSEVQVIAPDMGLWMTAGVLVVIGLVMTGVVYGAVALLVKLDDIGLKMAKSPVKRRRHTGTRIVRSMPAVFRVISIVGTVAMLWVGGHLLIENLHKTFWDAPYQIAHWFSGLFESLGPVVHWITETFASAVFGLLIGLAVVGVTMLIGRIFRRGGEHAEAAH